jgi:hypothetical protein
MFSSRNPFMGVVQAAAEQVRGSRKPVAGDNPFLAAQESVSKAVGDGLDAWREATEKASEQIFLNVYGSPALQAALGMDDKSPRRPRKAAKSLLHGALVERRVTELKAAMSEGGLPAALTRALLHVSMARGSADERGFEAVRRIRASHDRVRQMPLPEFKALVRDQFFMLLIDQEAALAAIPKLLPESIEERRDAFAMLRDVVEVRGALPEEGAARLQRIARLFDLDGEIRVSPDLLQDKMEGMPLEKPSVAQRGAARSDETSPPARQHPRDLR